MLARDGIIVGPHLDFDKFGNVNFSIDFAKERTRFYHFYFGEVAYSSMGIPMPFTAFPGVSEFFLDEDIELVRQGVSQYAGAAFSGPVQDLNQEVTNKLLLKTLNYLNERRPQYWISAYWSSPLQSQDYEVNQDIYLGLYKILPIPSKYTPIYEILEFKDRRRGELDALREKIDSIYIAISSSGDFDRARAISENIFRNEIKEIMKCLSERKMKFFLGSAELGLSISPSLIPGLPEFIANHFPIPVPVTNAILGGLTIAIGKSLFDHRNKEFRTGAYRVFYKGQRENIFRMDDESKIHEGNIFQNIKLSYLHVGNSNINWQN